METKSDYGFYLDLKRKNAKFLNGQQNDFDFGSYTNAFLAAWRTPQAIEKYMCSTHVSRLFSTSLSFHCFGLTTPHNDDEHPMDGWQGATHAIQATKMA